MRRREISPLLWPASLGGRVWRGSLALACAAWACFVGLALWRARLEAPSPTLLVRDREGRFVGELPGGGAEGDERLGFWPVEELPDRVVEATLAIEDGRFWWHPGVDPVAVARATFQNLGSGRRVSGASTIAMQVARLQHPGERGYLRKALEATTAYLLTARYGRAALLRQYLRIVPYGHRIHGIGYAARRYLDKPVADLSWAEIAFLAAIPQSPTRMDPYDPAGRARAVRRGRAILDRIAAQGAIPERELAAARAEIEHLALPWRGERPGSSLHALLRYDALVSDARRARDPSITSTLDLALQRDVEELAGAAVREAADRGARQAAALVVELERASVVAAVSSTGYFDREGAGAIDYLRRPRSSGSTLKPFLFALALDRGTLTPATVLDDLGPGPGGILNSDARFLGPLLPRVALANSRNVPAVDLLARLGLEQGFDYLGDLGLHAHERTARFFGLGLAIGSLPVTLEKLVTAYTALAGDGRLRELAWYRGQPLPAPRRVMAEGTAREITLFLSDPQARLPTFPRMGFTEYPFAVAVKTGTSSRYRDAWTLAWSRRYLVGVWVGHPDERPMTQLSGYRIAARLAQRIVERLHGESLDGLSGVGFPPPKDARAVRLCPLSGGLATAACDRVTLEWLPAEVPDPAPCQAHRRLAIDRRTGRLADARTPPRETEARTFVDLPARYAGWLARQSEPSWSEIAKRFGGPEASLALPDDRLARIEILSPEAGERLLRDPETPPDLNTLALRATVDPPVEQLLWYVDGSPFGMARAPFELRWPLAPGEHFIQARVPFTAARSRAVRITVE